jgi:hypothetical protein
MIYDKTKSTKRFDFGVSRNSTSHKAGANIVTIATRQGDDYYSSGGVQVNMTVKEARALQSFLNSELGYDSDDSTTI